MRQFTQDGSQRKTVEQHIKIVLFFTETKSVEVTQRWGGAHFQMQLAPSFKTFHKLYNHFNNYG
jgi:hypothetical protein